MPVHPDPFVLHLADLLTGGRPCRVLDCGTGAGRNAAYLAACGHRVVGFDASPGMLARFPRGAQAHDGPGETSLAFGRLEALPFHDQAFDAVVCTHVLETMRNSGIAAAVAELQRVVRPGGLLLLVTAAREGSDPQGGREVEPGTFVFDRQQRISAHLTDRDELARWTAGFATVARYLLTLEEPASAPFSAQWAFFGRRR